MFFLDSLYLWLDNLHTTLRDEHFLLRYEKRETDDKSDGDDGPAETIAREDKHKSCKEIVDRIIKKCSKEKSEDTRVSDGESCFRAIFGSWLDVGETERDVRNIGKAFLKLEDIFF